MFEQRFRQTSRSFRQIFFVEGQKTSMLSEFPSKHASNCPVKCVTLKRFAVLFFLPSCSSNTPTTSSSGRVSSPLRAFMVALNRRNRRAGYQIANGIRDYHKHYLSNILCSDQKLVHSTALESSFVSFLSKREVLRLSIFTKHL